MHDGRLFVYYHDLLFCRRVRGNEVVREGRVYDRDEYNEWQKSLTQIQDKVPVPDKVQEKKKKKWFFGLF